ncbi:MAG: hypothetical protein HYY04_09135 [Chloroflexi bacterium]|nr:hypothetical protein [Chloroflexota bacterium]
MHADTHGAGLIFLLLSLSTRAPSASQADRPRAVAISPLAPVPSAERFGLAHVSYGDSSVRTAGPASDERDARATNAGTRGNRWSIYWYDVERAEGSFDRALSSVASRERGDGSPSLPSGGRRGTRQELPPSPPVPSPSSAGQGRQAPLLSRQVGEGVGGWGVETFLCDPL